ncbi:MAG: acetyl-CoA carboxylase, carboxyltransferase subunit beta [Planctomycetota bacterium]
MAWHFGRRKKDMPDGLWMRCDSCGKTVYKKDVESSLRVCPECGFHFPLDSSQRVAMTLDPWSFEELFADIEPADPLGFVDRESYVDRLKRYRESTGLKDAIVVGTGTVEGWRVAFGVMETGFMMGSLGSVMGEKICRLAEVAVRQRIPMILVCGSGGARMQEGAVALMQMAKTSAAVARLRESGVAFVTLLTNPTTGGTTASFATEADVIIAEPQALIGFTGPRVIEETIKQKLPEGFQKSEFMEEHGLVDMVIARSEIRGTLGRLLGYLQADGAPPREEQPEKQAEDETASEVIGASGKPQPVGQDKQPEAGADKLQPETDEAPPEPDVKGEDAPPEDDPPA